MRKLVACGLLALFASAALAIDTDKAFDDPLYVRDEAGATYVPYSAEALARAGLPPFA